MAEETKEAIKEASRQFIVLYEQGKYEELWDKVFLPDGLALPPGEGPKSKDQLVEFLRKWSESTARLEVHSRNVVLLSDCAGVETARYKTFDKEGKLTYEGNSMVLWLKKDGKWLTKFDMWN